MSSEAQPADLRPPSVFLVGYYGVGNLGDEQIRLAIEAEAGRLGVEIGHWATRGAGGADPRAVRFAPRGIVGYLRACRSSDRVVLGGGGILKDEGLRLPVELLVTALAARLMGRPVTLLAVGVGPFYTRLGRWLVKAIGQLASIRTVRDEASARQLRELGVSRVYVGADPIFSTDVETAPAGPTTEDGERDTRRRAVVAVRHWFHKDEVDGARRWDELATGIARSLDALLESGWSVRMVGLYWSRDRDAADDVRRRMTHGEAVSRDDEPIEWWVLGRAVNDADLVIAMRYHALAAAVINGRPAVAVAYEPKVRALAEEVRVPLVDVNDVDIAGALRDAAVRAAREPRAALPDPGRVAELRHRARAAMRAALLGEEPPR